ncbi:hypothetical protein J2S17_003145 [Cytobacillus purgationiresistens]|uniref:Uncharacterized protein n=1 Tax=Cytobacillus purgationiresistens TaxID=863449 RepID=A0ABU0AJ17_9BACI|nr:hypothetical protein [Cytobacillus purgationiresistens]
MIDKVIKLVPIWFFYSIFVNFQSLWGTNGFTYYVFSTSRSVKCCCVVLIKIMYTLSGVQQKNNY